MPTYVYMRIAYVCIKFGLLGVSLSEPHTSRKNGTSVVFAKIYMAIRINGKSVMHS